MNGRVVAGLLATLLGVGAGAVRAQSPPAISLKDAVQAALATYPSLASAEAAVDRARAGESDARSAWLPSLSLDASAMRYQQPMVVAPLHRIDLQHMPAFDNTLAQGGVSLGWTVFDGGARRGRFGRARALEGAAESAADASRLRLLSDVSRAYLRVVSTREVLEANDRQDAALRGERDRAAKVFDQGRTPRVTVLRAEAGLAQAQAQREAARMDAELAERELARLMGVPAERVAGAPLPRLALVAPGVPGATARDSAVARAMEANPDVGLLRRQEQAARAGTTETRALWMPRLQLVGRYAQYGSDSYSPTREWQGGLQLSYPLFTGGSRLAAGERAEADLRAARADLAQARLRVESGVDQALAAARSAHARVAALETAVAQSEEVARIEKLALDAGSGVQTDYLTAEAQLLGVRASLTEARAAESGARIELARVTGELSPEWLEANLAAAESKR